MRIIFCGGGTAGHVTPAIAIAEYVKKNYKDSEMLFVGREDGAENKAIKDAGFQLKTVRIHSFVRSLTPKNVKYLFWAFDAQRKAKRIIRDFQADAVIGTGGYVSWPVIKAAQGMRIPTLIHESNACPGLVSKLLAPRCKRVLLGIESAKDDFQRKENIRVVGNPVRGDFSSLTKEEARRRLGIGKNEILISSFGGSGGSKLLNETVAKAMLKHSSKNRCIIHIHSSGIKYFEEMKKDYPALANGNGRCRIVPYVEDMATLLLASDIVISRCGAMTLSEICAAGVAAILIPSPNVTNDHQLKNAKAFADKGAAILIEEKHLSTDLLINKLVLLESDQRRRAEYGRRIKRFHSPDVCRVIYEEIIGSI